MNRNILPLFILLSSMFYIFFLTTDNNWIRLPFKVLPIILIMYHVWSTSKNSKSNYQTFFIMGLFFCMLGDAFILFSFISGLIFFFLGHVFYIIAFASNRKKKNIKSRMAMIPFVIYAVMIGSQIINAIKGEESYLVIPILFYITIITLMGWMSVLTKNNRAIAGAILFIISDSILAYNKFVTPILWESELIMVTYYLAQYLLAASTMKKN